MRVRREPRCSSGCTVGDTRTAEEVLHMLRHGRSLGAGAVLALAITAASAYAVGPPPTAVELGGTVSSPDGNIRYVLHHKQLRTQIAAVDSDGVTQRTTSLLGMWGVTPVTVNNDIGGVSHDGRLL